MRFPEFVDIWQKLTLKNFTERIRRKNVNNTSNKPLTISAQYGLIDQNDFFDRQIASKDMSGYYLLNNGEFAYNKSYSNEYPLGTVKRLDRYQNGALSSLYICFSPKLNIVNSDFLVHYFETSKWHKGILNIAGEGARNHGLLNMSVEDYFNTQHNIPYIKEQEKISIFLNLIITRIETQSKIIEDLELLKKSISHKIFGDNSFIKKDWKLTKLSDILEERKTYDVKESSYPHVTLSKDGIYSKSDRYNRDFLVKDEEKNYKITYLNDICYNPANLKFGVICLNTYGDAIFSPIYITYEVKDGNDAYFISQYVTNSTFIGHIRKYEQGTVYERMAVSSEDFLKGKIYLPPINIQNEISQIFKLLDKKINLELEILNKLKEQKKYLLSNMFI